MSVEDTETFFTISEQAGLFLGAVLLGAGMGAVFSAAAALRIIFPALKRKLPLVLCDILCMQVCGCALFVYSAVCGRGEIRLYYAAGAALGAAFFMLTIGTVFTSVVFAVCGAARKILHTVYIRLLSPIVESIHSGCRKLVLCFVRCYKLFVKFDKKPKNS